MKRGTGPAMSLMNGQYLCEEQGGHARPRQTLPIRISRASTLGEAKQAIKRCRLVSCTGHARLGRRWLAAFQLALPDRPRPPTTTTTVALDDSALPLFAAATGAWTTTLIHSFGIDRIHSFIHNSHSLSSACTASPHSLLLSNPRRLQHQPSPETPTNTSVSTTTNTRFPSWLRYYSLGSRPCANQSIAPRPRRHTSRDRT